MSSPDSDRRRAIGRAARRDQYARMFRAMGTLYGAMASPWTPAHISLRDAVAARCSDTDFGSLHAEPADHHDADEHTLTEVATEMDLTRQAVSQIQARALATLRLRLEDVTGSRIGTGQRIRRQVVHCKRCGAPGHNSGSCKESRQRKVA